MNRDPSVAGLASLVQSRGRDGDTMLVHMAPEEVKGLQALALAHGGQLSINPETGLYEANFLKKLLPTLIGAVLTPLTGGLINPFTAGLLVGGVETIRTGDLGRGLMAGLGAYGGAGLSTALAGTGAAAGAGAGEIIKTAGVDAATKAAAEAGATQATIEAAKQEAMRKAAEEAVKAQTKASLFGKLPQGVASFGNIGKGLQTIATEGGLGGIGSLSTAGTAFNAGFPSQIGRGAAIMGAANALTPEMEVPEGGAYDIDDSYYQSYGYSPEQGRFLGGQWRKGYPGFPGYAAGGSIMPRTNYDYPQAGITKSSYAPSLDYTQPQEVVDGYEVKLDPFTGEERFADGGEVGIGALTPPPPIVDPGYQQQLAFQQGNSEEAIRNRIQSQLNDAFSASQAAGKSILDSAQEQDALSSQLYKQYGLNPVRATTAGSGASMMADFLPEPPMSITPLPEEPYGRRSSGPPMSITPLPEEPYGRRSSGPPPPPGMMVNPNYGKPGQDYYIFNDGVPSASAPRMERPEPIGLGPMEPGVSAPRLPMAGEPGFGTSQGLRPSPLAAAPQQSLEQYYQGLLTPPQQRPADDSFMNYMRSLNNYVTSPVAPPPPPPQPPQTPPSKPPGDDRVTGTGGTGTGMVYDPTTGRFVPGTGSPGDTGIDRDALRDAVSGMFPGFNMNFGDLGNYLQNGGYGDTSGLSWDPVTGSFRQPGSQTINTPPGTTTEDQFKFDPNNFQNPFVDGFDMSSLPGYGQAQGNLTGIDQFADPSYNQPFQYDFSGLGQMGDMNAMSGMGDMGGYGTQFQGFQPLSTDFGSTYQAPAMNQPTFDASAYAPQQMDFGSMGYGLGSLPSISSTYQPQSVATPTFDTSSFQMPASQSPMMTGGDTGMSNMSTAPQFGFGNSDVLYGQSNFGQGGEQNIFGFAGGGAIQKAAAGKLVTGDGDGMSDDIRANINGDQEARLADGEFVIPADVVSHLGNGSTDAGADRLYSMMDRIRKARTGRTRQAPEIDAEKYLPA